MGHSKLQIGMVDPRYLVHGFGQERSRRPTNNPRVGASRLDLMLKIEHELVCQAGAHHMSLANVGNQHTPNNED